MYNILTKHYMKNALSTTIILLIIEMYKTIKQRNEFLTKF